MTDTVQDGTLRTRRSLLTAAAGGAAALAVGAIKPAGVSAGVPVPVLLNEPNAATALTSISNATNGADAFAGNATGAGTGSAGSSDIGIGVKGISEVTSNPATNTRNAGVVGVAGDEGAINANIALSGVYGYSDASPDLDVAVAAGVWGDSPDFGVIGSGGIGVLGDGGFGVLGSTSTPDGAGVWAESTVNSGLALAVSGRAVFSRSGKATVKSGNNKKVVNLAGCTASTLIIAVLAQNRAGRYVRAAVPASGKFTIYLNQNVGSATKVSWIALTNPANLLG